MSSIVQPETPHSALATPSSTRPEPQAGWSPPHCSPEALCMVSRSEVPHGRHGLGENDPDFQKERAPGGQNTSYTRGSVWEVWLRGTLYSTISGSFGLACFQKDADGGARNSFQE